MKAPPNAAPIPLRPKPAPRPAASPTKQADRESTSSSRRGGKRSRADIGSKQDPISVSDDDEDDESENLDDDDIRADKWPRKKLVLSRAGVGGHSMARGSTSKGVVSKTSAAGVSADDKALLAALTDPTIVRQVAFDDDARILIAVCDNATIARWDRV